MTVPPTSPIFPRSLASLDDSHNVHEFNVSLIYTYMLLNMHIYTPPTHKVSLVSTAPSTHQLVSHPETMLIRLKADNIGFGLSLQGGATDHFNYPLTISKIEEGGPAAK